MLTDVSTDGNNYESRALSMSCIYLFLLKQVPRNVLDNNDNSGLHTNDTFNIPQDGRVQISNI